MKTNLKHLLTDLSVLCIVYLAFIWLIYDAISVDLCHRNLSEQQKKEMELQC